MGFPPDLSKLEKQEILAGLNKYSLQLIGQHWQTLEADFDTHLKVFKAHLYSLASAKPLFINSQTGKDYFSESENRKLMEEAAQISQEIGIPIIHETHRGKWSFAAHKSLYSCKTGKD
jgi:hypothetical protein